MGTPGVQLTDDDLENLPYASQYVQLNGGPRSLWCWPSLKRTTKSVTQDQATLVTRHRHLVKTLLGGDNLIEVNNLAADPLIKPAQIVDGATWTRTIGWTVPAVRSPPHARLKWDGTNTVKVAAMKPRFTCWTKNLHRQARGITATMTAKGEFGGRNRVSARITR
ncbi:YjbF family lipoprotein [Shigella flexneri]